jgi:flagellar hook-associated protein 3 FlgL
MMTNLDPSAELFLAETSRIQDRIAEANRQVSSGKKISTASDATDQIGALLQLRAQQSRNTQIQSNLVQAKANTDAAESALASAISLMDSALTLASQGTNVSMTDTSRQALAQQVQSLQEQMLAISRTTVQGKYVFSGDQDGVAAYALNLTPPPNNADGSPGTPTNGVNRFLPVQSATRQIEDPAGGSFAAAKTGQEIFDYGRNADGTTAPENVFAALNSLRLALSSNDSTGITDAITGIRAASNHLIAEQAFYGTVQNRIQNAGDYASSLSVRLQTQLSQTEDSDVTSAALELTQATTQLQAAFQMRAKMPHNSLFDYLG